MLLSEKIAYLKGLYDGLEIDETKKEGKMIKGILDVLSDISKSVELLEIDVEDLNESMEESFLEDLDMDDDDDEYNDFNDLYESSNVIDFDTEYYEPLDNASDLDCSSGGCCCSENGCSDTDHEHEDEHVHYHSDDQLYEVVCPTCGEEIYFDEEILNEGSMKCHSCGEDLEFDTSLIEVDQDTEEE